MAGVHRLEHVEGFGAANLAYDDAIWAHTEGIADKLSLSDLADTFNIGRTGFQLHDMRLLQPQFDGVFDCDDPFAAVYMARHRV